MAGKDKDKRYKDVMIDYRKLGTVHVDELMQAVISDLHALKDIYNVQYVNAAFLRLPVTNEYGDPLEVKRPSGGCVSKLDTHHYRPACKDYEL